MSLTRGPASLTRFVDSVFYRMETKLFEAILLRALDAFFSDSDAPTLEVSSRHGHVQLEGRAVWNSRTLTQSGTPRKVPSAIPIRIAREQESEER